MADRPEKPWELRPDWAAGRIESGSRKAMAFPLVFAAFWNAIAIPVPILAWEEITRDGDRVAYLILLFPVVGFFLIFWALRRVVVFRKFGNSVLELDTIPAFIGRGIRGKVLINNRIDPAEGFHVKLVCVSQRRTGTGKNRRTSESIKWQEERCVKDVRREYNRTVVPIEFPIDADVLQSDESDLDNKIIWRVLIAAEIPGVDYDASFDVPVYRSPEGASATSDQDAIAFGATPDKKSYQQPADSKIAVTVKSHKTEIYFPPARNPRAAFGLTAFFAIWTGVVWGLGRLGAPLLFQIIFGLFDLLLAVMVLQMWLGITRLSLSPEGVRLSSGLVFAPRTRQLNTDAIADIKKTVGMQSKQTPYYMIVIEGFDGSKVLAGRGIKSKREAEWLVDTMKDAVGGVGSTGDAGWLP